MSNQAVSVLLPAPDFPGSMTPWPDTWTAAAVELTGATNAIRIDEPGADHSVQITELAQRAEVYDSLESWLGIEVNRNATKLSPTIMSPRNRFFDVAEFYH